MTLPKKFIGNQDGAAAVQYALVAGFMSLAALAGSLTLREPVIDLYTQMAGQANGALVEQSAAAPSQEG